MKICLTYLRTSGDDNNYVLFGIPDDKLDILRKLRRSKPWPKDPFHGDGHLGLALPTDIIKYNTIDPSDMWHGVFQPFVEKDIPGYDSYDDLLRDWCYDGWAVPLPFESFETLFNSVRLLDASNQYHGGSDAYIGSAILSPYGNLDLDVSLYSDYGERSSTCTIELE